MCLTLATRTYCYLGPRATDILGPCGYTETRFWQVVNQLVDQPAAERERPTDVRRLRRLRDARARQRSSRRLEARI